MKILHCALAAFYIDNYGYQENILPKIHKLQGHTVKIVASTETFINNGKLGYIEAGSYINEHGIEVTRIPYTSFLPHFAAIKLRSYDNLYKELVDFKPDLIFLHDVQFLDAFVIAKYLRKNPSVRLVADGHADYINSARNWFSLEILHKIIYRRCVKALLPFTEVFYGTLPARMVFFNEVYQIPEEKIRFLPMGADDSVFDRANSVDIRRRMRGELRLQDDDFVVITGGKIDKNKKIDELISSVKRMRDPKLKLIIFGSIADDSCLNENDLHDKRIQFIGWQNADRIYDLLLMSDLGVFPGTHSVLWEQTVGVGLPALFRSWEGMYHVDVGGNCLFLQGGTEMEITDALTKILTDREFYEKMKDAAQTAGVTQFSYSQIARRSLNLMGTDRVSEAVFCDD
ncbi:MAG: glycosyltransferase [Chryseobacterium sp.]|nr:MAG: glycosyltransferase [Chryseobacterium sp.]